MLVSKPGKRYKIFQSLFDSLLRFVIDHSKNELERVLCLMLVLSTSSLPGVACSKLTVKTLEQHVKYVQR